MAIGRANLLLERVGRVLPETLDRWLDELRAGAWRRGAESRSDKPLEE